MFYLLMLFSLHYNVYLLAQSQPVWDLPNYNKCVMFITYFTIAYPIFTACQTSEFNI